MEEQKRENRLAVLLAAAMFVIVFDTSLMNVSISAIIHDIDVTVSDIQAAVALEALMSAAFILVGSKLGDLIGRKRAYVLGLVGYGLGAVGMIFAQGLAAIIILWSIIGGLGAALLLPAMQSLIHGNFRASAQKRAYATMGAAAAIGTAVGPLLGGFITTYSSWRVGFLLEAVVIVGVLLGLRLVRDVPYTGTRKIDTVGAVLSALGMSGVVLSILAWEGGGEAVGGLMLVGLAALAGLVYWLRKRQKQGRAVLLDPRLFKSELFNFGISQHLLQQICLGGLIIALPIYLQLVFEYNALEAGLSLAPLSLSMFFVALFVGKRVKSRPSSVIRLGYLFLTISTLWLIPLIPRADSGWELFLPLLVAGCGFGMLVSQINNYALATISSERINEAAGVNSAAGSFGLSFGLAFGGAILLAVLAFSFNHLASNSTVLTAPQKDHVAAALEEDAEVMSNTQLQAQLSGQSSEVQGEMLAINTDARHRALQVALLIPLLASLVGCLLSFKMMRLPDPIARATAGGLH